MATRATVPTWPGDDVFHAAVARFPETTRELEELVGTYSRLIERPSGDLLASVLPPPFEAVGVLAALVAHAELELRTSNAFLDELSSLSRRAAALVELKQNGGEA